MDLFRSFSGKTTGHDTQQQEQEQKKPNLKNTVDEESPLYGRSLDLESNASSSVIPPPRRSNSGLSAAPSPLSTFSEHSSPQSGHTSRSIGTPRSPIWVDDGSEAVLADSSSQAPIRLDDISEPSADVHYIKVRSKKSKDAPSLSPKSPLSLSSPKSAPSMTTPKSALRTPKRVQSEDSESWAPPSLLSYPSPLRDEVSGEYSQTEMSSPSATKTAKVKKSSTKKSRKHRPPTSPQPSVETSQGGTSSSSNLSESKGVLPSVDSSTITTITSKQSKVSKKSQRSEPSQPSVISDVPSGLESRSSSTQSSTFKGSTKTSQSRKPTVIDFSDFEDGELERELEEIAINGRGGMIGGLPIKPRDDLEKGSDGTRESCTEWEEDEADKSWHDPLQPDDLDKAIKRRRFVLGSICSVLLLAAMAMAFYFGLGRKSGGSDTGGTSASALDARQQAISDIIASVTNPSLLIQPDTAQYHARQWMLYSDTDSYVVAEEKIIQRYSLVTFYFATSGDQSWNPTNWLTGDECAQNNVWFGLNCNTQGVVRALAFGKYLITGLLFSPRSTELTN